MNCPQGSETLTSFVDGELSPDEAARLEAHAIRCPSCSEELAELRELSRVLGDWNRAESEAVRPSRSFRDRVVAAVRPAPAAKSALRVVPGGAPRLSRPTRRARLPILFVASSAAAVLLIVLGVFFGGPSDDGRPATDDLLGPRDYGNPTRLLVEARGLDAAGDATGARQLYLAVLNVDPMNAEALAALGFGPTGRRPSIEAPIVPSLDDRIDGIDPEAFRPKRMVAIAPSEDFDDGIRFEGNLFSPLALDDFQRFRSDQYRLASDHAERWRSGAAGDAPTPPREHPIMAMVGRMGPVKDLPEFRHQRVSLVAIYDPGAAVAKEAEADGEARELGRELVTLTEAFEDRIVTVVDGGGGQAFMTNRSTDRDVFVPAGTVLIGGHQDRVTTRDVIVRAGRTEPTGIPVMCCEALRSTGTSRSFKAAPFLAGPGLRRLILVNGDQALVWERIRIQLDKVDARNRTQALARGIGSGRVRRRLAAARAELMKLVEDPRVIGFIAADGERILGVDVFGSHELFAKLAPTFLDSYLFDSFTDAALGHTGLSPERVERFLAAAAAGSLRVRRGVDSGADATIGHAAGVFGYAMIDDHERPVHVSLLPIPHVEGMPDEPRKEGDGGGKDEGEDEDGEAEKAPDGRGRSGADERIRKRRPGPDPRPQPKRPGDATPGGTPGGSSGGDTGGGSGDGLGGSSGGTGSDGGARVPDRPRLPGGRG